VRKFSLAQIARWLWAATLFTLPVTSFRYFPFLGDSTLVRPLALYPLAMLLLVLVIRWVRGEIANPWAGSLVVLIAFLLAVLLATMIGSLYAPLELRGNTYWGRAIRAWVTLMIGTMFFVAAIWMNRDEQDMRFSVRWLTLGLLLHFIWSAVQALSFYTNFLPRTTVKDWQLTFSMRGPVKNRRISGMAYEPSWLAGQIAALYMPWLFAAVVTRTRILRERWMDLSMLGIALFLLIFTYSRGGTLYAIIAALTTLPFIGRGQTSRVQKWFRETFIEPAARIRWRNIFAALLVFVTVISLSAAALSTRTGQRYLTKFTSSFQRADSFAEFLTVNYAGSRFAYAWGAMSAFNEHPWTGAGLGASGFYILQNIPDWAKTTLFEVAHTLDPQSSLFPNPKNLYVRLLAETGLLGFALYLAFQFSLLGEIRTLLRTDMGKFVGLAALFTWVALLLSNFTQDSLTTPNLWINLGIMAGFARNYRFVLGQNQA